MTRILLGLLIFPLFVQVSPRSLAQDEIRTIEIHAIRFAFTPLEITLKKGETVKLRLHSDDVTHALFIPDLNVNQTVEKSHPVDVTITPDSAGDFNGQCAHFCGTGHGSMV